MGKSKKKKAKAVIPEVSSAINEEHQSKPEDAIHAKDDNLGDLKSSSAELSTDQKIAGAEQTKPDDVANNSQIGGIGISSHKNPCDIPLSQSTKIIPKFVKKRKAVDVIKESDFSSEEVGDKRLKIENGTALSSFDKAVTEKQVVISKVSTESVSNSSVSCQMVDLGDVSRQTTDDLSNPSQYQPATSLASLTDKDTEGENKEQQKICDDLMPSKKPTIENSVDLKSERSFSNSTANASCLDQSNEVVMNDKTLLVEENIIIQEQDPPKHTNEKIVVSNSGIEHGDNGECTGNGDVNVSHESGNIHHIKSGGESGYENIHNTKPGGVLEYSQNQNNNAEKNLRGNPSTEEIHETSSVTTYNAERKTEPEQAEITNTEEKNFLRKEQATIDETDPSGNEGPEGIQNALPSTMKIAQNGGEKNMADSNPEREKLSDDNRGKEIFHDKLSSTSVQAEQLVQEEQDKCKSQCIVEQCLVDLQGLGEFEEWTDSQLGQLDEDIVETNPSKAKKNHSKPPSNKNIKQGSGVKPGAIKDGSNLLASVIAEVESLNQMLLRCRKEVAKMKLQQNQLKLTNA